MVSTKYLIWGTRFPGGEGGYDLRRSNREDRDDTQFCPRSHLQAPNGSNRQEEDDGIGDRVEDATRDQNRGEVDAMPVQILVPYLGSRHA